MIRIARWMTCLTLPLMTLNAADAQLEQMKSSYDRAVETATAKYAQRREKLEQELKTEKDKQFATLMTSYNEAIKRTTQKGDLEQANALLAERKQREAEHANEAQGEAKTANDSSAKEKDASREAAKASLLPPLILTCRLVEIRRPDSNSSNVRSFTFDADGSAWMGNNNTARNGEQHSYRSRLPYEIKGNKIFIDTVSQSSSSTAQRWIEIPLPLTNPVVAHERYESKSHSYSHDLRLTVEKREANEPRPSAANSDDN